MMDYFVHETAVIDEGCHIGKDVRIWHFCHIMSMASIGDRSSLGQNVFIGARVIIGKNNKIQNNVSLYEGMITEDDVFIGPSAVFTNVINPRSAFSRKTEYKATLLKEGCTIGANATIICGITIGQHAFVGAGAVVTKDVRDFELVTGIPARHTGWMSRSGLRLEFDEEGKAVCRATAELYLLNDEGCRLSEEKYSG